MYGLHVHYAKNLLMEVINFEETIFIHSFNGGDCFNINVSH